MEPQMWKGENMRSAHRITVQTAIALSIGLSLTLTAQAEPDPGKTIENNFSVSWSDITYNKRSTLRNPAAPQKQRRGRASSETLSLFCEIAIADPSRLLGVCRRPIIEEIVYGQANRVVPGSSRPVASDMKYDLLRYRREHVRTSPNWRNAFRSAVGLPRIVRSHPKWIKELEPGTMQIDLDAARCKQPDREIGRIKGYFYALVAESLEYVDVPFQPTAEWVRLTPDMEIRVSRASCQQSQYRLGVTERPESADSEPMFSVQTHLSDRLVVARYLLGPDDKPITHPLGIRGLPGPLNDRGEAAGGHGLDQIKKIRYVIAVNLTHRRIPFVLQNIPLPKP
jgi:hypothetical protein